MWEAIKLGKFAVLVHDKTKINKKLYGLEDLEQSSIQGTLGYTNCCSKSQLFTVYEQAQKWPNHHSLCI